MFRNREKINNFVLEVKRSGHKSVAMATINHERCSTIWWSVSTCKVQWFCWLISKICLTLLLAAMPLACVDAITTLFAYYKKQQTNKSRTKINIEKRFMPSFIIFNDLSNKSKFILGVRCILKGIWNEKFDLKKTLLFERTFEVIKVVLYNCHVSHFREIWICLICK